MLLIAALIVVSVGTGIAVERRDRALAQRLARGALGLLLFVFLPIVVLTNIHRIHLSAGVGAGLAIGYVVIVAVGLLAWRLGRRLRLPAPETGAAIVTTIAANTGYVGIPLAGSLLGASAVAPMVVFDLVVSQPVLFLGVFGVAAALGTEAGETAGQRVWAFFRRNLCLPAAVIGLLLPASTFSQGVVDASHVLVVLIAPLGFFALGVMLTGASEHGELELPPRVTRPVGVALVLRSVVAPALMIGLCAFVPGVPDAFLLAAAMPSGLNTLTAAHGYGLDTRVVASAIAWSTAIVLVGAAVLSAVL